MTHNVFHKLINCIVSIFGSVFLVLILSVTSFAAGDDTEFQYVISVYNEQSGLPTGEANTIIQTTDGYIWIGSYGGLIRYDGTNFRNFSVEKAIDSDSIRSLYEDSQGRIWIGTNDIGVVMLEDNVFTTIESPEDKSFLCVRDFAEGKDGTIYLASPSGMALIRDNKVQPLRGEEVKDKSFYSIAIDSYDRVWGCATTGECIVFADEKPYMVFDSSVVFDKDHIFCIDDENGNIIMGSAGNSVAVVSFPTESLEKKDLIVKEYSTGDIIFHNGIDSINEYILVSGNNGLAMISPDGTLITFGEKDKVMSVNSAMIDYEANVWMTSSNNGVIKYSQGCFESLNEKNGLEEITMNTITKQAGNWYIGNDVGLLIFDKNWTTITNELTELLKGVRIRNIMADSKGLIWISNYSNNPLISYDGNSGEITCYNSDNGLVDEKARVSYELSDGRIAVGMQDGLYILENGKIVESYGKKDGLLNTTILCIVEDSSGEILVGSDGDGIYGIKDGKVTNYGFSQGLEEGVILRMLKEADGQGYFVSAGSSLYYWEDGVFKKLTNFEKGAGSFFDIYEKDGKVWLFQNDGIISIEKNSLLNDEKADVIHYGMKHGLTGSLNANTWHYMSEDGGLFIATRNGISVFRFSGVRNSVPKLSVNRVTVDGQVYEHPEELILPSDAQRITIDYAILSYTDTMELRISTFLNGFDMAESLSSVKSGSVSYTNLPGGNYVFELSVYTPEADSVVKYNLPITKKRKVTEQPLFWVIMSLTLVVISCVTVLLFVRAKVNGLRRRQQEYKRIIDESLRTFAKTIDAKDPYTNGHSLRVAMYARELAKRMGMSELEQENIYYIALLHDIGKIGIPDSILNKPEKLSPKEVAIIRTHVTIGGEILEDFTALEGITEGARYHHERWDGKGYAEGLKGQDIPKLARIIGVADSYDAMSSNRCYRDALDVEKIISELTECSGSQFDPEVVPHMLNMIKEGIVPMKDE